MDIVVPKTPEEYKEYIAKRLNLLETLHDAATSQDERQDVSNLLMLELLQVISSGIDVRIPKKPPILPDLAPYNVLTFNLTTARTSPGQEVDIPGDAITAFTDGTLEGTFIRLDAPTNDAVPINEFNPYYYPAMFRRFWLETTAQSGRYLRLHIGREAGAGAGVDPSASSVPHNRGAFATGQKNVTVAGVAEQLSSLVIPDGFALTIVAKKGNAGDIYVGTSQANAQDATVAFVLDARDNIDLYVNNANLLWIDADNPGEGVQYVVEQ